LQFLPQPANLSPRFREIAVQLRHERALVAVRGHVRGHVRRLSMSVVRRQYAPPAHYATLQVALNTQPNKEGIMPAVIDGLRTGQAARLLGLSEQSVRTLVRRRKLVAIKTPYGLLVDEADAHRLAAEREQTAARRYARTGGLT